MAVNKVVLGDKTIIDLSEDTVSEEHVVKGIKFHRPDGELAYGELEASGGGGGTLLVQPYKVSVVDYEGTIIREEWRNEGDVFTLPEPPTHEGMIFSEWVCPLDIIDNTVVVPDIDLTIRPLYTTDDGASRLFITLDEESPKSFDLSFYLVYKTEVSVDWGDGSEVETRTNESNIAVTEIFTHEYAPKSYPSSYTISIKHVLNSTQAAVALQPSSLIGSASDTVCNTVLTGVHLVGISPNGDTFMNCTRLRYAILKYKSERDYDGGSRVFRNCYSLEHVVRDKIRASNYYFENCYSLRDIVFPSYVVNIGNHYDFINCKSVESVIIPEGVTSIGLRMFEGCTKLSRIKLPSTLTRIDSDVFKNCSSLEDIKIPEGVVQISANSFYGCSALKGIEIPPSVTSFSTYYFYGCHSLKHVTLPNSMPKIYNYMFMNCSSLEQIDMPQSVTALNDSAFNGCSSLRKIHLHEGITSIASSVFGACRSLRKVVIPETVTTLGTGIFSDCNSLVDVTFPSGMTALPASTFASCTSLEAFEIPDTITSLGANAFDKCASLKSVVIPNSVTSLGAYLFRECTSLQSVTIVGTVTSIPDYAFNNCKNLADITLPETVTSIGQRAFSDCDELTYIKMPSGLTSIKTYAFYSTNKLNIVDFRDATAIPTLGSSTNSFDKHTGFKIVVPDVLYDSWITATNWTGYTSYIFKASEVTIE